MMTDPISDMLTRIRNAQMARHARVEIPFSKLKQKIADLLLAEHYIAGAVEGNSAGRRALVLDLSYDEAGQPAITNIKRVSRPGRRVYSGQNELPQVLNSYGLALISTSAGLMTNKEARRRGLGGEVICEIY